MVIDRFVLSNCRRLSRINFSSSIRLSNSFLRALLLIQSTRPSETTPRPSFVFSIPLSEVHFG
ncbi:hypothetical protein Nepgr_027509, partial [Nepenthes gracilis]